MFYKLIITWFRLGLYIHIYDKVHVFNLIEDIHRGSELFVIMF